MYIYIYVCVCVYIYLYISIYKGAPQLLIHRYGVHFLTSGN